MNMTARDQGVGGVVLLARDASQPYYRPAPTTAAARVELWARDKGKGIDAAFKVVEGKPGGEFSIPNAVLQSRTLEYTTISYSASGVPSTDLARAAWGPLSVTANTGTAAALDEHVPDVTEAPRVAKAENSDEWIVFIQAPENASTLIGYDIQVEKAADPSVFDLWPMLPTSFMHRLDQKPYPCRIKYRARNQSLEDIGNGRGISGWSPYAAAAEKGASTPDPPPGSVLATFDPDPHDSRAGRETGVLAE